MIMTQSQELEATNGDIGLYKNMRRRSILCTCNMSLLTIKCTVCNVCHRESAKSKQTTVAS